MTEDKARKLVASVRRWNKRSKKTDMELIDDYQNQVMVAAGILLLIYPLSLGPIIENPAFGIPLVLCSLLLLVMLNCIGKCIGTKRLLIEKRGFNFE